MNPRSAQCVHTVNVLSLYTLSPKSTYTSMSHLLLATLRSGRYFCCSHREDTDAGTGSSRPFWEHTNALWAGCFGVAASCQLML